jgi:transposase-like protein
LTLFCGPTGSGKGQVNFFLIERLNQSVKQRTKVAKIFANEDSCLNKSSCLFASSPLGALKIARISVATDLFLLFLVMGLCEFNRKRLRTSNMIERLNQRNTLRHVN